MSPETLTALEALLRAKPRTAKEIAAAMGCSKPTVYERVRALKAAGVTVLEEVERSPGVTGPAARTFRVA